MQACSTTLFLCGDVMTGRGIDQILAHPNPPGIQEPYVRDARDYVALAEDANGPISRPVLPAYIWGDAIAELERVAPDARIINLETSVTTSDEFWPRKGIHYRMHPQNLDCLTAARPDVCVLANNHVLDYGHSGLEETLRTLAAAGLTVAGAGTTIDRARDPAIIDLAGNRRILVFAVGSETSGIPPSWAATVNSSGVDLLPDLSATTADDVLNRVRCRKRRGDIAIVSVHWGDNWGYEVPPAHVRFAHRLLDGEVDLIHGHSSHHPRPIEIYNEKLVLYGCGDFINDYEGISRNCGEPRHDASVTESALVCLCQRSRIARMGRSREGLPASPLFRSRRFDPMSRRATRRSGGQTSAAIASPRGAMRRNSGPSGDTKSRRRRQARKPALSVTDAL